MQWIDTHAHIYLPDFKDDLDAVVQRAVDKGIHQIFMPNIDSASIQDMLWTAERYPHICFPMMGLHPCSVKHGDFNHELATIEKQLSDRPFAAIGEIGMDLYWDKSTKDLQSEAFTIQCRWAMDLNKPVVIHSREAIEPLLRLCDRLQDGRLTGIFHCFSGDIEQAKQILKLGFYLGIGGPLTYKKSTLPTVLEQIPLEKIVLETDAPYLPPVPFRGKRNECSYLIAVAEKLAEIYQCSLDYVSQITTQNAKKVYQIEPV